MAGLVWESSTQVQIYLWMRMRILDKEMQIVMDLKVKFLYFFGENFREVIKKTDILRSG